MADMKMESKTSTSRRARSSRGGEVLVRPQLLLKSRSAQTLDFLRKKLDSGDWVNRLPSERELSGLLVIGRGTLRKALADLEREGRVRARCGRGCGWEIIIGRKRPSLRSPTKRFVVLAPYPLDVMAPIQVFWIDYLREHLGEAGYQVEVRHDRAYFGPHANDALEKLEKLAKQIHPAGWVLLAATAPIQRWFSERSLPCVIVGSRHQGVKLPSVDSDYPAACRHAAGKLLSKGYTRLALLIPESGLAGDLDCENSFREAAEQGLGSRAGEVLIVHHDRTPQGIRRRLNSVLKHQPAPTGFLVTDTKYTLGTLSFMLRQGLRLPEQAALISRDDNSYLEYMVPTIARYATNPMRFARKISRAVLRLAQGGSDLTQIYRVMPEFIPGETLG